MKLCRFRDLAVYEEPFSKKGKKETIAFPYTYFYPIPSPHRRDEDRQTWIEPESYGVHY